MQPPPQLPTTAHNYSQPFTTAPKPLSTTFNCSQTVFQLLTTAPNYLQLLSTAHNCLQLLIANHNCSQLFSAANCSLGPLKQTDSK